MRIARVTPFRHSDFVISPAMTPFQNALDLVYSTLRDFQEQGSEVQASAASLSRLAADEPDLSSPRSDKAELLAKLRAPVLVCTKCPHLVASRTQVVFGVGNAEAELMFVGEAPGEDEDKQG